MSFIWKSKPKELNKKIDLKEDSVPVPTHKQNISLKIALEVEYPINVDIVDALTTGKIRFELPEGIALRNPRLTNLELL
jgi:hypothetical protein